MGCSCSAVEGAEGTSSRAGSEASDSLSHAEPLSRASSVEPPQAHHSAGSGSHRLLHWHHLRPPGGGLQEDRLSDGLSQMQSTGSSDGGFSGECSTNPLHNGLLLERIKTAAKVRAGTMCSCILWGSSGECSTNPLHNGLLLECIKTAFKVRAETMCSCILCGRGRLCLGVAAHWLHF